MINIHRKPPGIKYNVTKHSDIALFDSNALCYRPNISKKFIYSYLQYRRYSYMGDLQHNLRL